MSGGEGWRELLARYERVSEMVGWVRAAGRRQAPLVEYRCRRGHRMAGVHATPRGLLLLPERQDFRVVGGRAGQTLAGVRPELVRAAHGRDPGDIRAIRVVVPARLLDEMPADGAATVGCSCSAATLPAGRLAGDARRAAGRRSPLVVRL